jgi:hypothetical protein
MLALMFDLRFKNMQLVTTYLGCENVVVYDEELLLHLLIEVAKLSMHVSIEKVEDFQSQVHAKIMFHTTTTNVDTYMDLVSRELIGFYWCPFDIENFKYVLS